jgi:50S ribosomal protein L16 3-hydroxylase
LLGLLADQVVQRGDTAGRYRDPGRDATLSPGRVPDAMQEFASNAVRRALDRPHAIERALGQWLTEPKPQVWFDAPREAALVPGSRLRLDRRTRMAHDDVCAYVNGEAYEVTTRDASVLRRLADARTLSGREVARLSPKAREWVADWLAAGWVHSTGATDEP